MIYKKITIAIFILSYNDAELDYLYDYYTGGNDDNYDTFSSLNAHNTHKVRQGGTRGNALSNPSRNRNGQRADDVLTDLPIVNQRENGIQFFPTPSSANTNKFTSGNSR